ncbi:MAG: LytTR family DNA-binding domain-containing protein [Bacteroidetes bacterium]|nr:LytTR family DNA-binding domain-containing protein [Bacteroidota bacterium]
MKITCIAIDDEPLALDIIKDYCSRVPFLNILKTFDSALESIDFIRNNKIDLLFLDIQMEELTGIQLLNILKQKPLVIFTTAHDTYALHGFELDVVDYLLKPISFERFLKAVDKVYEKIQLSALVKTEAINTHSVSPKEDYFFVKTEFRFEKIHFSEILYIEGMGDYLRIFTQTKKIMTLQNFQKMEEMLPPNNFCRVHKSYIVALDKIDSIERNRIKISDRIIPISESYKKTFFDFLEKRKL